MNSTQLKKFQRLLLDKLAELEDLNTSSEDSRATVTLDQTSVGRLSRMDAMQGQQMALESERRRKTQILQVTAALKRIEEDEYGYCFECGEEIPPGRLEIAPETSRCIDCMD